MGIVYSNRRTFLRGLGASLALPFLASARPPKAWAADIPPTRLIYLYKPNGWAMDRWAPVSGGETDWVASDILAPALHHREHLIVLEGVDNEPGNYREGDALAGAHFQQTPSLLTAQHVGSTSRVSVGISADQIAANALGYVTPFRSLQLGVSPGSSAGACGSGWPCAYLSNISWRDASTPLPNDSDPRGLFQKLFSTTLGVSEAEFNARKTQQKGLLDVIAADARSLSGRLGATDRQKLDQYLTAVEETERKVDALAYGLTCDPGEAPNPGSDYLERLDAMLDVLVLALECDLTRIATFMTWGGGASHTVPYDWVSVDGVPVKDTFHTLSHHGNDPDKLAAIAAINAWEMTVFAGLLDRLQHIQQSDGGTLLDHSTVCFLSEVSDGDTHSASNLPVLIGGRGGGTLDTGRFLARSSSPRILADVHLALLQTIGVSAASLGEDGTAPMTALLR